MHYLIFLQKQMTTYDINLYEEAVGILENGSMLNKIALKIEIIACKLSNRFFLHERMKTGNFPSQYVLLCLSQFSFCFLKCDVIKPAGRDSS